MDDKSGRSAAEGGKTGSARLRYGLRQEQRHVGTRGQSENDSRDQISGQDGKFRDESAHALGRCRSQLDDTVDYIRSCRAASCPRGPCTGRTISSAVSDGDGGLHESDDYFRSRLWPFGRSPALVADPIMQAALFILAVSLVFLAYPGIDIWFSTLFYHPDVGFPMNRLGAFVALRSLTEILLISAVIILIAAVVIKLLRPTRPTPIRPCDIVFLLTTLALGPGLIVNAFFKEFWGRPRPSTVDLFGGEAPFVGIWQISDSCASNCSFVSGEAAAAMWLVAVAIVAPGRWRKPALILAVVLAVLLSLNRIAFGRHFLSDVLLAWGLTLLVVAVIHRIVVEHPPTRLANDHLEAHLTNLGLSLRQGAKHG
jgi:lipid A 4'-phosphatase